MSDIEKAYLCEQEYKKHEKHDDVQLIDLVRTCGFETLHDYFQAKNEYLISLKNMQIVHYQIDAGLAAMKVCDSKKGSGAFAIDEECTWAWVGSKDFNDELAISIGVRPSQTATSRQRISQVGRHTRQAICLGGMGPDVATPAILCR